MPCEAKQITFVVSGKTWERACPESYVHSKSQVYRAPPPWLSPNKGPSYGVTVKTKHSQLRGVKHAEQERYAHQQST